MAIWQVICFLCKRTGSISFDAAFSQSLQEIQKIFPEEKSWCSFIKQYGNLESTCMEIELCDDGLISNICFRIDARSITHVQLQTICAFAKSNQLLVKHDNTFYEATVHSLCEIFKNSKACQFLHDPERYLRCLEGDNREDN